MTAGGASTAILAGALDGGVQKLIQNEMGNGRNVSAHLCLLNINAGEYRFSIRHFLLAALIVFASH